VPLLSWLASTLPPTLVFTGSAPVSGSCKCCSQGLNSLACLTRGTVQRRVFEAEQVLESPNKTLDAANERCQRTPFEDGRERRQAVPHRDLGI